MVEEDVKNNAVKAKRGRKSKKELLESLSSNVETVKIFMPEQNGDHANNITENILFSQESNDTINGEKPIAKKRGRKPKGGKIIQQLKTTFNQPASKPNIILHLKCGLKDLTNNNSNNNIESYNFVNKGELTYDVIKNDFSNITINDNEESENEYCNKTSKEPDIKEIWKKIKQLQHNLHINNISDKKSACFWCTYDFVNPPIYIPKHYIKNSYDVYGCFCSPECAVAYLMEENIDSSTKFERYHFINYVYGKIYNYEKNIKPAPNPYYMLDKYYGNLTIQEYRSLFKNQRLFLIVDKPLTRVLPELHEDNEDFILNNKIIPSNNYQLKKITNKKLQNKLSIMNEKFGIIESDVT